MVDPERLASWKMSDEHTQSTKPLLSVIDPERSAVVQIVDEHARDPKRRAEQEHYMLNLFLLVGKEAETRTH